MRFENGTKAVVTELIQVREKASGKLESAEVEEEVMGVGGVVGSGDKMCHGSRRWEEIGSWENVNDGEDIRAVSVDVDVRREVVRVYGVEGVKGRRVSDDGFVWFRAGAGRGVGLSVAIVEKMKWVEEEGGWVGGREKEVRVRRVVGL